MLERTLLFVDTSYLLASFYNSWETGARAQLEIDLPEVVNVLGQMVQTQLDQPVHRQLWYDGIPDSGPHRYQRSLRTCEGVQLRAGHLIEWGERRTQKAVDTRLVADMVLSAARGQVSDFVLVSGDADMIPGVEEAVTAGIRVHLYGFGWDSMSSLLRHACDSTTILDPREDFAECMQLQVLEGPLPPVVRSRTTPEDAEDASGDTSAESSQTTSGEASEEQSSDSCCTPSSSTETTQSGSADSSEKPSDTDSAQAGDSSSCCQEGAGAAAGATAGATSTAMGQHAKRTEEGQAGASASKGSIRRDHSAQQDADTDSEPLKPASPQPGESIRRSTTPAATPAAIPGAHARLDAEAEEHAPAMPEPKHEQPAETIDPAAEVAASTSSTPRTVAEASGTSNANAETAKDATATKDSASSSESSTSSTEAPKPTAVPKPSMMAPRRKLRSRYVPLPNEVWASGGYQTPFDVGQQYASWWYEHAATTDQRDNAHLLSGGGLPPEIDRPLLQFACETLHEYTLSETQRVSLRDGFHSGIRGVLINVSRRN